MPFGSETRIKQIRGFADSYPPKTVEDGFDSVQQLGEYLMTAGLSYLINLSLFRLCLSVIGLSVIWSAVVALPPSTLVVFLLLNYRVFRHRRV